MLYLFTELLRLFEMFGIRAFQFGIDVGHRSNLPLQIRPPAAQFRHDLLQSGCPAFQHLPLLMVGRQIFQQGVEPVHDTVDTLLFGCDAIGELLELLPPRFPPQTQIDEYNRRYHHGKAQKNIHYFNYCLVHGCRFKVMMGRTLCA